MLNCKHINSGKNCSVNLINMTAPEVEVFVYIEFPPISREHMQSLWAYLEYETDLRGNKRHRNYALVDMLGSEEAIQTVQYKFTDFGSADDEISFVTIEFQRRLVSWLEQVGGYDAVCGQSNLGDRKNVQHSSEERENLPSLAWYSVIASIDDGHDADEYFYTKDFDVVLDFAQSKHPLKVEYKMHETLEDLKCFVVNYLDGHKLVDPTAHA